MPEHTESLSYFFTTILPALTPIILGIIGLFEAFHKVKVSKEEAATKALKEAEKKEQALHDKEFNDKFENLQSNVGEISENVKSLTERVIKIEDSINIEELNNKMNNLMNMIEIDCTYTQSVTDTVLRLTDVIKESHPEHKVEVQKAIREHRAKELELNAQLRQFIC